MSHNVKTKQYGRHHLILGLRAIVLYQWPFGFFLDVFVALSCSSFVSKEYGILLVTLSSYLG